MPDNQWSVDVDVPSDRLYEMFMDPENFRRGGSEFIEKIEEIGDDKYRVSYKYGAGRGTVDIRVEPHPHDHVAWKYRDGGLDLTVMTTFAPLDGDRCHVTQALTFKHMEASMSGAMSSMANAPNQVANAQDEAAWHAYAALLPRIMLRAKQYAESLPR